MATVYPAHVTIDVRNRPTRRRLLASRAALAYPVGMSGHDKRKQSLYFPEEMLKEIGNEATRQDRSLSWIVQKAWKAARKEMMSIPSVQDISSDDEKSAAK
jgi:uncharacterized small protein (TIGR04563 family)